MMMGVPNVGKSTLVNALLGQDRMIVSDQPGTTRDSIYVEFARADKRYTLIDTAGMRKRGRVAEAAEEFSVVRTLQAIEDATLCPGCGRRVKENWMVCPGCHTKLKKNCHQCGKLMELPWNLCPYCGTPAPGMRRESMTLDEALRPAAVETEAKEQSEGEPT